MKAIRTKYHGPGNVRGSRVSATDEDGNRVSVPYNHAAARYGSHDAAALELCRKMGWTGTLIRGSLGDGFVYVFDPREEGAEFAQVIVGAHGAPVRA